MRSADACDPVRAVLRTLVRRCVQASARLRGAARALGPRQPLLARTLEHFAGERQCFAERLAARAAEADTSVDLTPPPTPQLSPDPQRTVAICERGEAQVLEAYDTSLDAPLPPDLRALLAQQRSHVRETREQFRRLAFTRP